MGGGEEQTETLTSKRVFISIQQNTSVINGITCKLMRRTSNGAEGSQASTHWYHIRRKILLRSFVWIGDEGEFVIELKLEDRALEQREEDCSATEENSELTGNWGEFTTSSASEKEVWESEASSTRSWCKLRRRERCAFESKIVCSRQSSAASAPSLDTDRSSDQSSWRYWRRERNWIGDELQWSQSDSVLTFLST